MGKTIKLGGFGMSQGKCKPPDKRYRRKKKLLPGSLVVLFLGVLFIAVLAGMKSAQFLEPINTSFTPCGESSIGSPRRLMKRAMEKARKIMALESIRRQKMPSFKGRSPRFLPAILI